ncbi:MAG: hypothetical protein ACI9U2_001899, partial [Bradymonadia bacterium]
FTKDETAAEPTARTVLELPPQSDDVEDRIDAVAEKKHHPS